MQLSIINKLAIIAATLAVAFGAAFTAFAYEELEIEIDVRDNSTRVEVEYQGAEGEVNEVYEYEETDLDQVYDLLAEDLDISTDEVEDAVTSVTDEDEEEDEDEEGEESDEEEATEAIEDAEDAIAEAEEYVDSLFEGVVVSTTICDVVIDPETGKSSTCPEYKEEVIDESLTKLKEKLADAKALLEKAEVAFDDGNFERAEDKAEAAEDLAEEILDDEDEDEKDEEDNDFCDRASNAAGWGVAKKCVDDDDYEINDKMEDKVDRFADFGKTNDRAELQNQLRELLVILIQLLQQQMALDAGVATP